MHPSPQSILEQFYHPQNKPHAHFLPPTRLQPKQPVIYFCVCIDFPILDILYKWNHTKVIHCDLRLICFQNSCCGIYQCFISFSLLSNSTQYCHILFVCSSDNEHLSCLHFLAVMNKIALQSFTLWMCIPKSRISGSYGLCLTFWGAARLFSKVAGLESGSYSHQ